MSTPKILADKGKPVPTDHIFKPAAHLIARCVDVPDRRPSFEELNRSLRAIAGLPWILPPAVHEEIRWGKLESLPEAQKRVELKQGLESVGARVGELGFAMKAHEQAILMVKNRCGAFARKITRIFIIDNALLRGAFQDKIDLLKVQLDTTYFSAPEYKEKERKQVHSCNMMHSAFRTADAGPRRIARFDAVGHWRPSNRGRSGVPWHFAEERHVNCDLRLCQHQAERLGSRLLWFRDLRHPAGLVCG